MKADDAKRLQDFERENPKSAKRQPTVGAFACIAALALLYLIFVIHYSVNGLLLDDWGFVHLIDADLHGHLTMASLWAQHNENRMFVPNLFLVTLAVATHDNERTVMILSAVIFIGSYLLFLIVLSAYLNRALTAFIVAATGPIWFSLADWQNALWGFQFAWYLILFLMVAMLCLLSAVTPIRSRALGYTLGLTCAVTASFSSAQGLFLWPIGAVLLMWGLRGRPKQWSRRSCSELLIWLLTAFATAFFYFFRLRLSGGVTNPSFAFHHPWLSVQSVLANIGNVFPTSNPDVGLHETIGAFLFVGAGIVIVQSFHERLRENRNPLPVVLILFALLFDPSIASTRLAFGVVVSLAPRYTMANLLIPLAIVSYALVVLARSGVTNQHNISERWGLIAAIAEHPPLNRTPALRW